MKYHSAKITFFKFLPQRISKSAILINSNTKVQKITISTPTHKLSIALKSIDTKNVHNRTNLTKKRFY